MSYDEYYLTCDIEELKTIKGKTELLRLTSANEFIWFCQEASAERIEALLDEKGIEMLLNAEDDKDFYDFSTRIYGLCTCEKDLHIFQNEHLCEAILKAEDIYGTYGLQKQSALDLMKYVKQKAPERCIEFYQEFDGKVQQYILQEMGIEPENAADYLKQSKKEAVEFLLKAPIALDLSNLSVNQFEDLLEKNVPIPAERMTAKVIQKLASICDVNQYRFLIEKMSMESDVAPIEAERKKFYEQQLQTIGEDGLLACFKDLLEQIDKAEEYYEMAEIMAQNPFLAGSYAGVLQAEDKKEAIKKINHYVISNMILDYLMEDIPTNAIKNICTMLDYQKANPFLDKKWERIYYYLANIDHLTVEENLRVWNTLKGTNMVEKFYDDFSLAKEKNVEQINKSILTPETLAQFGLEDFEKEGVPIYYLNGQDFYVLVRNIGISKSMVLSNRNLHFFSDGVSFSVDGSKLLNTFGNIHINYALAYSSIPKKQLIHIFPLDSFSEYHRDPTTDVSRANQEASDRRILLNSPEQLTTTYADYNEILLSVPNCSRKENDFEKQLEEPKAFAIYCYDSITKNDIESAKRLGLGIILVNTKAYTIDKSQRKAMYDTMKRTWKNPYNYMSARNGDERDERDER